jgi:DNA-binding transcriptional LysR family regulator
LTRTTRRLSLTTAGRTLLESTEPAIQHIEAAWRTVGNQAEQPSGHLKIAAPANFIDVFGVDRLARFLSDYPAVSLEMVLSDDETDLIGAGVDMALRVGPIKDQGLVARRIASTRLIVVASPACIAQYGAPANVQELADYPCLLYRGNDGRGVWPLQGPQGPVSHPIRARLAVNGMGALIAAARSGLGAALVPEVLVEQDLAARTLQRLLPAWRYESGGLFAVYPSRKNATTAMKVFLDFIVASSSAP